MSLKDTSWTNPEGRFLAARIVYIDPYSKDRDIFFTVPAVKMEEFEKVYRESIKNAVKTDYWLNMWKMYRLEITTEKKTYKVFISWDSDHLYFENGLKSYELQNILNDIMEEN
jgi:hypothetical protein